VTIDTRGTERIGSDPPDDLAPSRAAGANPKAFIMTPYFSSADNPPDLQEVVSRFWSKFSSGAPSVGSCA
jgi:hypothetical protein